MNVIVFTYVDVDECLRPGACGHGAICTNNDGSYACSCPEETIPDPDPYIKCVGVVTCNLADDCPGNAICDSQKRCLCPEPNIGNDCRRKFFTTKRLIVAYTIVFWHVKLFLQILAKIYLVAPTLVACY